MPTYTREKMNEISRYIDRAGNSYANDDIQNTENYLNLYYNVQVDFRGYATSTLKVINNEGIFGQTANQNVINAIGQDRFYRIRIGLMLDLARADLQSIEEHAGAIPTENQINNIHYTVYPLWNIPLEAFGGAADASLGSDWSFGTLKSYEIDKDLTNNYFLRILLMK